MFNPTLVGKENINIFLVKGFCRLRRLLTNLIQKTCNKSSFYSVLMFGANSSLVLKNPARRKIRAMFSNWNARASKVSLHLFSSEPKHLSKVLRALNTLFSSSYQIIPFQLLQLIGCKFGDLRDDQKLRNGRNTTFVSLTC